jgi:hypothetical protein
MMRRRSSKKKGIFTSLIRIRKRIEQEEWYGTVQTSFT